MGLRREILDQAQRRIDKAAGKVMARLQLMVTRGQINSVDDSTGVQNVKVGLLKNEIRDKVERFQRFGFTSSPPVDAEAVVVFIGGNRDHGVVIAEDERGVRITGLGAGESAQYSDGDNSVILRMNGDIEITPGAGGNILVGGVSAVDFVQKADTFTTVFDAALTAAIAAAALILPPNGGDGGSSALAAFQTSWDAAKSTFKATNTKVL